MTAVLFATISEPVSVLGLALAVGIAAQWVGKRLGIPSIVFMLGAGLVCGPWLDLIDPDASFGPLLTPMIGLGVGLLLFQGARLRTCSMVAFVVPMSFTILESGTGSTPASEPMMTRSSSVMQ